MVTELLVAVAVGSIAILSGIASTSKAIAERSREHWIMTWNTSSWHFVIHAPSTLTVNAVMGYLVLTYLAHSCTMSAINDLVLIQLALPLLPITRCLKAPCSMFHVQAPSSRTIYMQYIGTVVETCTDIKFSASSLSVLQRKCGAATRAGMDGPSSYMYPYVQVASTWPMNDCRLLSARCPCPETQRSSS